tara:strand:+ start:60 stop:548 length:489 start_codon:yes stop_codon:yes gene_type:complete
MSKDKKKDKIILDLEDKVKENLRGWQKALADYQNLQKETDKKLGEISEIIKSNLILEILPIFDNYYTALNHIPEEERKENWAIGLEHILKIWESFLESNKIKKINSINKEFDFNLHESIGEIKDKKKKDQIIIEEKEIGYMLKNRIIRPSKVIINNISMERK